MTAIALVAGFALGIAATHAMQKMKRRLRRKINRMLRSGR